MRPMMIAPVLALAMGGCATSPIASSDGWGPESAIVLADGRAAGAVRVRPDVGGLALNVVAHGLPPGVHGLHLHAVGRCDGPKFESAGPHWNPAGRQHGHRNPAGWHAGDLGNVTVGADGRVSTVVVPDAAVAGPAMIDADGAALVLHAKPDDERTDPSGNSGDRIACAVLR
jgi:superoxide dismutase, Cu-Zn family